jgi:hypothetical protein
VHRFDFRRRLQEGWDFDVRTIAVTELRPNLFKVLTSATAAADDLHARLTSTNPYFITIAIDEQARSYLFVEVVAIPGCIRFSVFVFIASHLVTNKVKGSSDSSKTNVVTP